MLFVIFVFQSIEGSTITFSDNSTAEADVLMFCTGYKIDLPFLPQYVKAGILNEQTNELQVLGEKNKEMCKIIGSRHFIFIRKRFFVPHTPQESISLHTVIMM